MLIFGDEATRERANPAIALALHERACAADALRKLREEVWFGDSAANTYEINRLGRWLGYFARYISRSVIEYRVHNTDDDEAANTAFGILEEIVASFGAPR